MDVAALNLSVDSSDVVKATADLDKFSTAATKAGASTGKVSSAGNTAKLAQDYARAARAAEMASGSISRIADAAVKSGNALRAANDNAGRSFASANAHVAAYEKHLASLPAAANQAAAGIGRVSKAAQSSIGALQSNTGNIAAQFQDIGVTAAMGMNPLIIGLQQGTQLSAVFAQSGASMGTVLAGAFKQIASAQALTIIGLVAGVAALVQLVDWGKAAEGAMRGLANIIEDIAPYALAAAAALALIYAPAIIAGVATLTKGFIGLAASMLACIPIPVLIVAGLTAIVAAANHWRDDLTRIFGVDIVAAAKDGTNYIVGSFVGAYNAIVQTWSMLPDAVGDYAIQTANRVIDATNNMINAVKRELNELIVLRNTSTGESSSLFNFNTTGSTIGRLNNPNAGMLEKVFGMAQQAMNAGRGQDYVGMGVNAARGAGRWGADTLRGWANGMGAADKADKAGGSSRAAEMSEEARALQERNRATEQYIKGLTDEVAKIGLSDEALRKYEVTQALARATTDAQRKSITDLSAAREKALTTLRQTQELEAAQKQLAATRQDITGGVDIELQTMHLVGAEREKEILRIQRQIEINDLLAKIKAAEADGNVKLADTYRQLAATIDENYAKKMQVIDAQPAIDQMREFENVTKRGLDTLNNGLVDAIMGTRSLGSVFKDVANQIIADLIRIALKQLIVNTLMKAIGGGAGGGGGFLGSLIGGLFANGGTFGTAQRFADGGTFTNSIVSNPTLFKFANGGKLGLMGEEGPEAIMPLSRLPNGKLGVHAQGGGNGSGRGPVNVKNEITNHYSVQGAVTPSDIMAMIRQGGEATMNQVRGNLESMLQQLDQDGVLR